MKLELGSGHRPTRGYATNDLHAFEGIDYPGPAWMLDLDDNSLDEVLALGFVEHLTFYEALDTFRNVHRMLKPGGLFLFDVPDYPVWCRYYLDALDGKETPVSMDHIRKTLFGWARWPGDEHKFGWDWEFLSEQLRACGFLPGRASVTDLFKARAHRDRFHRPDDAHIYAGAGKP